MRSIAGYVTKKGGKQTGKKLKKLKKILFNKNLNKLFDKIR